MIISSVNSNQIAIEELEKIVLRVAECKSSYMIYRLDDNGNFVYGLDYIEGFVNSAVVNKNKVLVLDAVLFEEKKYTRLLSLGKIFVHPEFHYNNTKFDLVAFIIEEKDGI